MHELSEVYGQFMLKFCIWSLVAMGVGVAASLLSRLCRRYAKWTRRVGLVSAIMLTTWSFAMVRSGVVTQEDKEEYRGAVASEVAEREGISKIILHIDNAETPRSVPSEMSWNDVEHWSEGAYMDGIRVDFAPDWTFPHGSNHLSSVEVMAWGEILPDNRSSTPIASLGRRLSLAPNVSSFRYGRTPSNTYAFAWVGARDGRINGEPFDGTIELVRNGDVAVTTNGVAEIVPRVLPFPHDGFGQDDEWVAANFTNATEILAVGYPQWVDQQVGEGLTNGLYKFTAEFLVDPPEATELYVGDYSVCVTNAGVYSLVLEKGKEYEFGTWPFNDDVDYWAQDDMAPGSPTLRSMWGGVESPGKWTVDGGWNCLTCPSFYCGQYYNGHCSWWPTLRGTPDVSHLGETDFPKLFSAIVSDYPNPDGLSYEWRASDGNVMIMSPHSRETLVAVDSMPSWDIFDLSVSTDINGQSYASSVRICYGTNDTPVASLKMSAPKVVFVNDDGRTSRWYRVSAQLVSPTPTNAVLAISHSGGAQVRFATDPEGRNGLVLTNVNLSVEYPVSSAGYEFFFASTNNNCTGTFTATCTLADSTVLTAEREYKVIEPLRKLVCNEQVAGGYYNPSRLVYGTNAWLKVGVNGQFSASEVQWRVVSGPGRIVSRNDSDWAVSVEPTAQSGEVVVEAAFGRDSLIQPRFVLPIVTKRIFPVRAFIVGTNTVPVSAIEARLEYANRIFMQSGVSFDLISVSNNVALASDAIVSEFDVVTNKNGHLRKVLSQQARRVMDTYTSGDCLELYFVAKIINGKAVAFRTPQGIVISGRATDHVVAHEIGHCFGLKDCYVSRRTATGYVWIEQRNDPIDANLMNKPHDWGQELKRGFYEKSDTREHVLYSLLMYGIDGKDGVDIPSGDVLSLMKEATQSSQTQRSCVGADYFKTNDSEVFTR